MGFNAWAGLVAGFVATVVMSVLMAMARAMKVTRMPSFEILTGSMMSTRPGTARVWGTMIHYLVLGTVVFGLIYAALFTAFDTASWLAGLIIGVVHGLAIGMIMPMMPMVHPRMSQQPSRGAQAAGDEVRLSAPGLFGRNWGSMTPLGVIIGHAVYGVVLALVYSALT